MYSSINLVIYYEKNSDIALRNQIKLVFSQSNIPFKELHSLTLLFQAIKNPQNYITILASTPIFLETVENIAQNCFDYQNRIFVVNQTPDLIDYFFNNYCLPNNLCQLEEFIKEKSCAKNTNINSRPQTLLYKLIKLELEKMEISAKYVGFNYLVSTLTNALRNDYYSSEYIDLFKHVASTNLVAIDTVERDIRHMLISSWKRNIKFKETLQSYRHLPDKPNAKSLLDTIINYLKNII